MTNREIILHCLKENTDVTCRKSPCDKPEQEGNTGECCDKCALGILEEYEREMRSKAIDDCIKAIKSIFIGIMFLTKEECNAFEFTQNKCIELAEQLKVGGE